LLSEKITSIPLKYSNKGKRVMGNVVELKMKKNRKPITIDGKTYVYLQDFAERVGVTPNTIYQWRSEGRVSRVAKSYLGKLIFEEKAIEPFKRSLMESVSVTR
jgi:hypothetical protein